jgi:hypothetical protein
LIKTGRLSVVAVYATVAMLLLGLFSVDAQQAKLHNTYNNTKLKSLKENAAIWFLTKCVKLTPKYANIRINGNNRQTKN